MSTEIHPPLDASADVAPHDEYCARLMKTLPAGTAPEGVCFCSTFAMVRADELLNLSTAISALPASDGRDAAKAEISKRLIPHLVTALLPSKP